MFNSILLATSCMEPAKRVPLVVNPDYGYGFTDHEGIGRQLDLILDGLPECPKLFIFSVCVYDDFVNEGVKISFQALLSSSSCHILSCGHTRRPAMVGETRGLWDHSRSTHTA